VCVCVCVCVVSIKEKRRLAIRNAAQRWEGIRACLEPPPTNGAKEEVSPENSPAHSPAQTNGLAQEPSPDEPRYDRISRPLRHVSRTERGPILTDWSGTSVTSSPTTDWLDCSDENINEECERWVEITRRFDLMYSAHEFPRWRRFLMLSMDYLLKSSSFRIQLERFRAVGRSGPPGSFQTSCMFAKI